MTVLSKENDRLQANDKRQKTTGSIVFKNVEAAIAIVLTRNYPDRIVSLQPRYVISTLILE